jgi:hypothetical protein
MPEWLDWEKVGESHQVRRCSWVSLLYLFLAVAGLCKGYVDGS